MIFVIVSTAACVIASVFQCTPINKAWHTTGSVYGSCINVNALFFANARLDIFQDAFIYVLPTRMLYQIQIPKRQKIALMMVFAVGGFVVITGMVRLKYLKGAQSSPDPSYDNYGGAIWSSIECNMGVVCASLPAFKPPIDRFFPNLIDRSRGPSEVTPRGAISAGKRGYARKSSQSDCELEDGSGWKNSYTALTTPPVAPRLSRVLHSMCKAAKSIQDLLTHKARVVASGGLRVWWSITAGFKFKGCSRSQTAEA